MAGSYNHITTEDGSLASPRRMLTILDNGGDVFETIEQMYGMIWYLANGYYVEPGHKTDPRLMVVDAIMHYKEGLSMSPTKWNNE